MGFTSLPAILPAVAFHAVTGVAGIALVAKGRARPAAPAEEDAKAAA
jgi:hypothetical protein